MSGVEVDTKYGAVEGKTVELHNGISINSFLGIPFAKAPVGDLRWQVGTGKKTHKKQNMVVYLALKLD